MTKSTKQILGGLAAVAVLAGAAQFVPLREILEPAWRFIRESGGWGYLLFVLLGTVTSLCMLPVSPITVASGILFGFWAGLAVSGAVLLISSAIGFILGRLCWHRFEHRAVFQNKWLRAVQTAIDEEGVRLIGLLRLTPFIPYTVGNIFYGSLSLRIWSFLPISLLGMLPGTAVLVYAGDLTSRSFGSDVDVPWWNYLLLVAGVVLFVGIGVVVKRKTQRILDERANESETTESA